MTDFSRRRLIPFYFGAIESKERLSLERDLLSDPELLLDYFELKREIESAEAIPAFSSEAVFARLVKRIESPRTMAFGTLVGAIAASVLLAWYFGVLPGVQNSAILLQGQKESGSQKALFFDASGELSHSSGVF